MNTKAIRKMALVLALTIPLNLLAGCKQDNKSDNEEETQSIEIINNSFKKEDLTKFLIQMSEIIPVYNLEEVFLTDKDLEELIQDSKNNQECDNKVLDVNEIYSSIIANSLDDNGLLTIADDISLEEKEELDKFLRECLKIAIGNMVSKKEISLEDACVIKNLRIIFGKTDTDSCLAYYGKNKVLVIDYERFKSIYDGYESEDLRNNLIKEGIIRYIELGLTFPRMQVCDCRLAKGQQNTSIGVECLIRSAFYSRDNSNLGNVNQGIFDNLGSDVNHNTSVLLLLAVFKENRNIENLYQIVFDSDLDSLYKYFGLTTKEDIEKFYKIARTMETLTVSNDIEEDFYAETTSTYSTAFRDFVGYGFKADILKTCISDLMKYIVNNKDLNKEEAMFLYKYVKRIILSNTGLNSNDNEFEPNFAKAIISLESIFFDFLSKFYNLDIEEVDKLYEDTWLYGAWNLEDNGDLLNIDCNKLIAKFPLTQFIEANYIKVGSFMDNFDKMNNGR